MKISPFACTRFMTAHIAVLEQDFEDLTDPAFTIFAVWGLYPTPRGNYLILLDMKREHLEGDQYLARHDELATKWKTARTFMHTLSYETKIVQDMIDKHRRIDRLGDGDDAHAYIDDDPYARVMAATSFLEKGMLLVPESEPWMGEVLKEWTSFPKAKHAESVTVLALACAIAGKEQGVNWHTPEVHREAVRTEDRDAPRDPMKMYYIAKPRGMD